MIHRRIMFTGRIAGFAEGTIRTRGNMDFAAQQKCKCCGQWAFCYPVAARAFWNATMR